MSKIAYDPVKDRFARLIRRSRWLRSLFYKLLDLFFLRSWYVRRVLRNFGGELDRQGPWKLLDAGCGFGQYDRFILKQFDHVEVTAVDIKEDYLEDCRLYFEQEILDGRILFHRTDLLEFADEEQYDFVLCVDVLEHIEEDVQVMRNLRSSLKPGGYFLMHSPSIFAEADADDEDTFVEEHARTGYSEEELRDKMEAAELTPIRIAYTYGDRGHRAWELLIKYPMLWMTRWKLWVVPFMAIYYLFTLPVGLVLMRLDMKQENRQGTGIYGIGKRQ